jgi:HD-GYP domain-containing protein (c-di-GMP phosphodiesterase class II)
VKILTKLNATEILSPIMASGSIKKWHDLKPVEHTGEEVEAEITDTKFTRIKIDELFEDAVAAFDFYLRLGTNRYIKIIHQGETASSSQLKKYAESGAKFLYFLASDRADFIGYQNELTSEMLKKNDINEVKILKSIKSVTDKYIEEVFVQGIQPHLIEEGKNLSHNMYQLAKNDKSLRKLLSSLEEFNPAAFSHSFLVSFFCTVISKNLDWVGVKTLESLSLGALFHDIGLVQLPEEIVNKKFDDMTDDELVLFKQHPKKGTEALQGIPSITASIQHIVLQHHETTNGAGFPMGLSGHKIFPLAKIVGLADGFSDFIMERECSPLDGIKDFLAARDNLTRYDSELVKSLVKGFIAPK